ncbi:hypothetical protein ACFQ07_16930 [Actinomadura adrarensis]|uniref:SRPBCC family protein n=1 Tax=Actinomadura adrarensis TaxID=1819600 RepID=A0ABW3CHD7_9ACTN
MAKSVKIRVTGSPDEVRPVMEQALQPEGFTFTWGTPTQGTVEKGSGVKSVLLGVISPHYMYGVVLQPQQDGSLIVELSVTNTGTAAVTGGAIGVMRVRKQLDRLGKSLQTAFQANDTLVAS